MIEAPDRLWEELRSAGTRLGARVDAPEQHKGKWLVRLSYRIGGPAATPNVITGKGEDRDTAIADALAQVPPPITPTRHCATCSCEDTE